MKLEIKYSKKTETIKRSFNEMFPFLKIEFFNKKHTPGDPSTGQDLVKNEVSFGEIKGIKKEGSVTIHPDDSVASVEKSFQKEFGLAAQIFRKQNNVWIETTRTDALSLAEQNEKGKEASVAATYSEPGDRYLEDGQF